MQDKILKKKGRHREQVPIKKSNSPAGAQLGMGPQPGTELRWKREKPGK